MVTRRPRPGDVFVIPLGSDCAGVGQVVGIYGGDTYYFAVFDTILNLDNANSHAVEALSKPIVLLALSMDAKLHAGHWTIVDHAPVAANVRLPAYKEAVEVGSQFEFDVVDYSGARHRRASQQEIAALRNRKVVAPVRLERALRAWAGMEPWLEMYDELRPEGQPTTAEYFGDD